MEPAEVYAAAGYRGVQIALPATETFITTLASGQTPNELHALYPASTKQRYSKAQRLFGGLHKQQQKSEHCKAIPPHSKQHYTQQTQQHNAHDTVKLLEEHSLKPAKAIRTVRLDHVVPLGTADTACASNPVQNVHSRSRANSPGRYHPEQPHQQHSQLAARAFSPSRICDSAQQFALPCTAFAYDGSNLGNASSHLKDDNHFAKQFCQELAEISASNSKQQRQETAGQEPAGVKQHLEQPVLQQLRQVIEASRQPLQQCLNTWQLKAEAAEPVWQLLQHIPFFNRLPDSLGPAVCRTLLVQRLPAGAPLLPAQQQPHANSSSSGSSSCQQHLQPLAIVLAGELAVDAVVEPSSNNSSSNNTSNNTSKHMTILGPGTVLKSDQFLAAAEQPGHSSCSCSSNSFGQLQTASVGKQLAAEVLLLPAEAVFAAVRWWGAACLNHELQHYSLCCDGMSPADAAVQGLSGVVFPRRSFFITQSAAGNAATAAGTSSSEQRSNAPNTASPLPAEVQQTFEMASNIRGFSKGATASGDNSADPTANGTATVEKIAEAISSSSSVKEPSSYFQLLTAWRSLPMQLQQQLLHSCCCRLLPAGHLVALAGRRPELWQQLAAGTVLEVCQASDAAAATAGTEVDAAAAGAAETAGTGSYHTPAAPRPTLAVGRSSTVRSILAAASSDPMAADDAGSRISTVNWDQLLCTAGAADTQQQRQQQQQMHVRSPAFMALDLQEQWQYLAFWNQLGILQQYTAGQQLILTIPDAAAQPGEQQEEPLQTLQVTAEPCLIAAVDGARYLSAVSAVLQVKQQQKQQQQAAVAAAGTSAVQSGAKATAAVNAVLCGLPSSKEDASTCCAEHAMFSDAEADAASVANDDACSNEVHGEQIVVANSAPGLAAGQGQPAQLYSSVGALNIISFLAPFVEDTENLYQQKQSSKVQQREQRQKNGRRNLAVAMNQLGLTAGSPATFQGALMKEVGGLRKDIPAVQVHSMPVGSSSITQTMQPCEGAPASAAVAGVPCGVVQEGLSSAGAAVMQAAAQVSAAAAEASSTASSRQEWLKSELFDPFGMLQPQLKAQYSKQQQVHTADGLSTPAAADAGHALSRYYSVAAASNQRQLGVYILPGKLQLQRQAAAEVGHLQKGPTAAAAVSDSSTMCSVAKQLEPGAVAGAGHEAATKSKTRPDDRFRWQGGDSSADEEDNDGLVELGSKRRYRSNNSWQIEHHAWTVPAYSSETGYIGGLYDESTSTMYIN